ncbi:hypothetical protein P3441_22090 [Vibrio parahaemolyticus]|nr:hypothetical protein [Vibrio parahaemolyticus]MDF4452845.1 hypothetical protein [Vibrio parahaemolyticus]
MKNEIKELEVHLNKGTYRFVKVNGTMTKIDVKSADAAFEAAMNVRSSRKKDLDKELFINGVNG